LLAVIEALRKLKKAPLKVLVFTDSKYVVDAVEKKWLQRWVKTNFKDKKNVDLWKAFLKEYPKHEVRFQWIKGHNNHPQNERCDVLAVAASKGKDLYIDSGFVKTT
jgi:ribonuclease HI